MEIKGRSGPLEVSDCNCEGSVFDDVSLAEARFRNSNLSRLSFTDVDLQGTILSESNLCNVEIRNCNLDGMRINGIAVAELFEAYEASKAQ